MRFTRVHTAMACAAALALHFPVQAQEAPRSFAASPDVYRVIGEDDRYRVIAATWAPGQRDNWHSHGAVVAVYALTDCTVRLHTPDGQYRDGKLKAGDSRVGPQAPKHVFENAGGAECRMILFEPK